MTTAEAAKRVGLAPSTLLAKAKRAGVKLDTIATGRQGRPGYRWRVADVRAACRAGKGA